MRPRSVPTWHRCGKIALLQMDWLRVGIVVQRTHLRQNGRRFVVMSWCPVDRLVEIPVPIATSHWRGSRNHGRPTGVWRSMVIIESVISWFSLVADPHKRLCNVLANNPALMRSAPRPQTKLGCAVYYAIEVSLPSVLTTK